MDKRNVMFRMELEEIEVIDLAAKLDQRSRNSFVRKAAIDRAKEMTSANG